MLLAEALSFGLGLVFPGSAMTIDRYYSDVPLSTWQRVLCPEMHYHFGAQDAVGDPFDHAVRQLYRFVEPQSSVLDCGCGWGGPARMLIRDLGCHVEGVTISRQQYDYIDSFKVHHADLHDFVPEQGFDLALFIESLAHVSDPSRVIGNLSARVSSILIKDYVAGSDHSDSDWNLTIRSREQYHQYLEGDHGYVIVHYEEYPNILHPSVEYWYKNIRLFLSEQEIIGQVKHLHDFCLKSMDTRYGTPSLRGVVIHAVKS